MLRKNMMKISKAMNMATKAVGVEKTAIKKITIVFLMLLIASGCVSVKKVEIVPQHLIVAEQYDLRGYDPGSTMSDFIRALIFNNLIELDLHFKKVPGLATQWSHNEDATQWSFKLREGVSFHDGEPFNAEAAKFNLDYRRETTGKAWLSNVESVEVVGEYEIVIQLYSSNITFDSDLTPPFLAMISPKSVNETNEVKYAAGTGPFKLETWDKDTQFVLLQNEDYYEGSPTLSKITFKVIPDAQTRAMALENGEVHMMSGREALSVVTDLQHHENINISSVTSQTSEMIYLQTTQGPLADIRVRKAIISAIDLSDAIQTMLPNMAVQPKGFFSTAFDPYVANLTKEEYDSEELLQEAGYSKKNDKGILMKDGIPLSIRLVLGASNEEDKLLSVVIADQLKHIGVDVQLVMLESGALRESLNEKNFDLIMIGQWLIPHDEPTTHYLKGYWHSQSTYKIYVSDILDQKIDLLHHSLDKEERLQYHHEIQRDIADTYAQMVVFHRNNVILSHKDVKNFEVSVGTWQIYRGLRQAYIEQ